MSHSRSNRRSKRYRRSDRKEYSSSSSSSSSKSSSTYSNQSSSSEEDHHYKFRRGEKIGDYKIKRHIFDGTFGRVLKVRNHKSRTYAMKIVRRNHVESAEQEADILDKLRNHGLCSKYFVQLQECFYHHGYFCMVFEKLGLSLYQLIRINKNKGLPMYLIKSISKQLLKRLDALHKLKIIHTDLKPENILFLKNYSLKKNSYYDCYLPQDDRIKVIDLGGAVLNNENHDSIINTRQYRAPEVQLQCCDWDEKSDVWGIACIIAEMYTGNLLFQTRKNEFEHVALMQKITGQQFPLWMCQKVKGTLAHGLNQIQPERVK